MPTRILPIMTTSHQTDPLSTAGATMRLLAVFVAAAAVIAGVIVASGTSQALGAGILAGGLIQAAVLGVLAQVARGVGEIRAAMFPQPPQPLEPESQPHVRRGARVAGR